MKIVSLEIKKITIGRFFPKEDKLELDISFNDGVDKEILKVVNTADAKKAAEEILSDIIRMEKNINRDASTEEPAADIINIVVKGEDKLVNEMSRFIQKAKIKIDEIKNKDVAEGYLDMIRNLKSLKIEF